MAASPATSIAPPALAANPRAALISNAEQRAFERQVSLAKSLCQGDGFCNERESLRGFVASWLSTWGVS